VEADDLGVQVRPADLARYAGGPGQLPAVVARGGDLEQAGHTGDLEVRALRLPSTQISLLLLTRSEVSRQLFPGMLSLFSCSATWRRNRNSSARSAGVSGSSEPLATVSTRRRSSRTHLASEPLFYRQLAGYLDHERPVSMTL